MKGKIDRRILRTKQLLYDVLLDLALEKSIESITVKELTDRAGLNRGTFYLHYQDLQEFYEQLKNGILEQYYSIIKKLGHSSVSREPFVDPPLGFVRPFEFVFEQKRFFQVFMGHTGDNAFSLQMTELIKKNFLDNYLNQHQEIKYNQIPVRQHYLFSYLASAYVGTIQLWIQRDFDLSPSDMTILFSQISRLGSAHI